MKYIYLTIFLISLLTAGSLKAQFHSFRSYSLEQGLPQSEINSITDDHLGYLWIGTNGGGLCRFDGRTFDVISKKNGLPDNVVISVFQDGATNLWIATGKGIARYDGRNIEPVVTADTTMFYSIARFFQTSDGTIWLFANNGINSRALYAIKENKLVPASTIFPNELTDNEIYYTNSWSRKQIIISTRKGIFTIDNGNIQYDSLNERTDTKKQIVIPLLEDRLRRTWLKIIDHSGVYRLITIDSDGAIMERKLPPGMSIGRIAAIYEDRDGGMWTSVMFEGVVYQKGGITTVFNQSNGLPSSIIQQIFQDREGNFWFGSSGEGLIKYSGDFFTTFTEASGINDDLIIGIYQDSKGNKYFTDSRGGLNKFDGSAIKKFVNTNKNSGVFRGSFTTHDGRLVLGSDNGLWYFDGDKFTEASAHYGMNQRLSVHDLLMKNDTLYVATGVHGLVCVVNKKISHFYNTANSAIASNFIKSLFADSSGRIWIATDKGVSVLNHNTITTFGEKEGLMSSNVFQFAQDRTGHIWIANFTGGLVRYDGRNFTVFNSDNGLESDVVYSVTSDLNGNIWAGSQLGVEHLTINSSGEVKNIFYYDRNDGFTGIENNAGAALCDHTGTLWFGTVKGVMRCIPGEKIINQLPPSVFVDRITINNTKTSWKEEPFSHYCDSVSKWHDIPLSLHLPPEYNHISFSFDALCYSQPEKVQYRWKLSPVDQDFCPPTHSNTAAYTMLPPGDYSLQVIACNNDGVWNNVGDTFTFKVTAAWWKTGPMKIILWLIVIAAAASLVLIRRKMVDNFRNETEKLSISFQIEHRQLKKRINELESSVDNLMEIKSVNEMHRAVALRQFELLTELHNMRDDKMSEQFIISHLQRLVSVNPNTCFFGYSNYHPESKSLVFIYSTLKNERQSVFSYMADDDTALPVVCLKNQKGISSINHDKMTHKLIIGDFHPQSFIMEPFTTAKGQQGIMLMASEKEDAFDHLSYSIFKLAASMMRHFQI